MTTDDWHGAYRDGWQGEIVPEAFCHPAKYSRSLIRRIYQHAREEGWVWSGGSVEVSLAVLDEITQDLKEAGIA